MCVDTSPHDDEIIRGQSADSRQQTARRQIAPADRQTANRQKTDRQTAENTQKSGVTSPYDDEIIRGQRADSRPMAADMCVLLPRPTMTKSLEDREQTADRWQQTCVCCYLAPRWRNHQRTASRSSSTSSSPCPCFLNYPVSDLQIMWTYFSWFFVCVR
jgi:hypothetical protein